MSNIIDEQRIDNYSQKVSKLIAGILETGKILADKLKEREKVTAGLLQQIMSAVFGAADHQGAWLWKDAYDAVEIALVLYWRQRGKQLLESKADSQAIVAELEVIEQLCPTHTKRSEETLLMQQFSTPIPLAYLVGLAADIRVGDVALEPSAGTGLLAVFAQTYGAQLLLNEIGAKRVGLLRRIFADAQVLTVNGEQIDDYMAPELVPSVVVMNPPFSASPKVNKRTPDATVKHIGSALARLSEGGRLVAITANWFSPLNPKWKDVFINWQSQAQLVMSVGIAGQLYQKHGTTIDTRLMVFDKIPAPDPIALNGVHPEVVESNEKLLELIECLVPPRQDIQGSANKENTVRLDQKKSQVYLNAAPECLAALSVLPLFQFLPAAISPQKQRLSLPAASLSQDFGKTLQLGYTVHDWRVSHTKLSEGLYETYEPQSITIAGAATHPSPLVESAAMAAVAPPKPTYKPYLPERVLREGLLSVAQMESIIYAGQAHQTFLSGYFVVDDTLDRVSAANQNEPNVVQFRRGWYLGDGTGCGKGRQVAGMLLDNWLQGRCKAIWVSKSDKLIEDARRDWSALGGNLEQILSLNKFRQGEPIDLDSGIIFVTYATLRTESRQGKKSRVMQLIDWCGHDFEGVIAFDESHAMSNAASEKGSRGMKKPSQQGIAGLRLQYGLPKARVLYVSATGATTVNNLAYAVRLGIWQTQNFPFRSQSEFVSSLEQGGIAAMEVVSRDLKMLGLYLARSLSYEGVRYEVVEHELTEQQIEIYDSYADAFQIIHQNIDAALVASNITDRQGKTRNSNAKSAARSAFEGNKQRFFNHLLTSMKCPSVIRSIEQDLSEGHAIVVQIVSTNEALLERRLAEIPSSEFNDIRVDITPREYVLDYLLHSFPTHLHEIYTDDKGNEHSRAAVDADGNPVLCKVALRLRDEMIERLALLPPVSGALDQLVQYFGHENVAEVTGRSRRIVRVTEGGIERLVVQNRPASVNLSDSQAFMDDRKRILVFSEAGGTGRSYHADLNAANQRLRVHYLLEAGWRADNAIQGLGRSNRTNQKQPPLFRPITTNVKGEKRFISTIARRLDTLGALTRGQRQTGGQGLFQESDNLESSYAKAALRQLYYALYTGRVASCSLKLFEETTGLSLSTEDGFKEELPPISQFLNRVLALKINLQNALFEEFEMRLNSIIEGAIASGTYEVGVETLKAFGFRVLERREIYQHPETGAKTTCCQIEKRTRSKVMTLDSALALASASQGQMILNERSGRVALFVPTTSILLENGSVQKRVSIVRPLGNEKISVDELHRSHWNEIDLTTFSARWTQEVNEAAEFVQENIYVIAGLLLPIWNHLPSEHMRVYRLQCDDGERILGRVVQSEHLASVYRNLGIDSNVPELSASEIYHAVYDRRQVLPLGRKWKLRSTTIANNRRLEIEGVHEKSEVELLKRLGCMTEMINWKLRVFIPVGSSTILIIEQICNS